MTRRATCLMKRCVCTVRWLGGIALRCLDYSQYCFYESMQTVCVPQASLPFNGQLPFCVVIWVWSRVLGCGRFGLSALQLRDVSMETWHLQLIYQLEFACSFFPRASYFHGYYLRSCTKVALSTFRVLCSK